MIYECKQFLDTNIYRSFNLLLNQYAIYFKNLDKGIKYSKGIYIDNLISQCISNMAHSYKKNKYKDKLEYAYKAYDLLFEIEIHLKGLYEAYKSISETQYNALCKICGKLEEQLNKWISKIESTINVQSDK